MHTEVFAQSGSVVRSELLSIFEIKDENDRMMLFQKLLGSFGDEVLRQNQIIYLEKKFKKLTQDYDSLNYKKKHLIYLMEAYDFSKKERIIPGQLKLFELLPEVMDKDLDKLADIKKRIETIDKKRSALVDELIRL